MKSSLSLLLLLFYATKAFTADWTVLAEMNSQLSYDNNLLMQTSRQGSFFYHATPTLMMRGEAATYNMAVTAGYKVNRYSSLASLNTTTPFLTVAMTEQGEKWQATMQGQYEQKAVRTEAFEDTGNYASTAIVERWSWAPKVQYQLSETQAITTSLLWQKSHYRAADLVNHQVQSADIAWQAQLSPTWQLGWYSDFSIYTADDEDRLQHHTMITGIRTVYQLDPDLTLQAHLGYRHLTTNRREDFARLTNNGYDYALSSSYQNQKQKYTFAITTVVSPSSLGQINERKEIKFNWQHQYREKLQLQLAIDYQRTKAITGNDQTERENWRFSSSVWRQISRQLQLGLQYSYRQQSDPLAERIKGQQITLKLDYDWGHQ